MRVDEPVKAQLTPEGKFALLLILLEISIFAICLCFGQPELGFVAGISFAILLIAMRATWRLHEHGWYWGAVVVSTTLQRPFVSFVPWSNHAYRGTALVALGFLDFLVVFAVIKLCERLFELK